MGFVEDYTNMKPYYFAILAFLIICAVAFAFLVELPTSGAFRITQTSQQITTMQKQPLQKVITQPRTEQTVPERKTVYVYGAGLVATKSDTMQYHHQDALGSNRFTTSTSAELTTENTQYPYGAKFSEKGSASDYKFTGKEQDDALYYYGARYYDPASGRFISVDPALDTSASSYAYAADNPLKFVDPSGMQTEMYQEEWYQNPWPNAGKTGNFFLSVSGLRALSYLNQRMYYEADVYGHARWQTLLGIATFYVGAFTMARGAQAGIGAIQEEAAMSRQQAAELSHIAGTRASMQNFYSARNALEKNMVTLDEDLTLVRYGPAERTAQELGGNFADRGGSMKGVFATENPHDLWTTIFREDDVSSYTFTLARGTKIADIDCEKFPVDLYYLNRLVTVSKEYPDLTAVRLTNYLDSYGPEFYVFNPKDIQNPQPAPYR